jgi:hypothetical protein
MITDSCPNRKPLFCISILKMLKTYRIRITFSKVLSSLKNLIPITIPAAQYPHEIIVGDAIGIL